MKLKVSFIIILLTVGGAIPLQAATPKPEEKGAYLTKSEVVQMISTADFMKKKIADLISWSTGYDISRVNRVRLTPSINYVQVLPRRSPPDGRTIIDIVASVDDPGGLNNIAGVRADLSSIGRFSNTMLVDNGLFGDKIANDGIYTLQTSISPKIEIGNKDIQVAAANKKGWLALAKTSMDVQKNPSIQEVRFLPDRIRAVTTATVIITARLDNPGRIEDIQSVTANLKPLSLAESASLHNDGQEGDETAGDNIWSIGLVVPSGLNPGTYSIPIEAVNRSGGFANASATLTVEK